MRREKRFEVGDEREGLGLTVTRKGVEVRGWYDHLVGMDPIHLIWEELLAAKAEVEARRSKGGD